MTIRAVGVVVPIHNEEELLPACLTSVRRAAEHPTLLGVTVCVVPVLDACSDRSLELAGPGSVVVSERNVGMARAAGVRHVLSSLGHVLPDQVWLAMTDADTTVPPDWLGVQVTLADQGADAVAGSVRVADWSGHEIAVSNAFAQTYGIPDDGHAHVHGANLGVRASAYLAVGGFPPVVLHEDVALLAALRGGGLVVLSTGRIPVTTSARPFSRTSGGFADHLRNLVG